MKEKRGFTLIELLAVIVILAIIALIAVPIVLNLIGKARQGAAEDTAYGVRKEAQLLYQTTLMNGKTFEKIEVDFSKEMTKDGKTYPETKIFDSANPTGVDATTPFEIDGTKPESGKVTINVNGIVTYENIVINGYECDVPSSGKVTCGGSSNGSSQSLLPAPTIDTTNKSLTIGEGITAYCINTTNNVETCTFEDVNQVDSISLASQAPGSYYIFVRNAQGQNSSGTIYVVPEPLVSGTNGQSVELDGYKWHIVGQDDERIFLLLDAFDGNGTADDNRQIPNMVNCSTGYCDTTNWGVQYGWEKSLIREYLNDTFYNSLSLETKARIVPQNVCKDLSAYCSTCYSYGGYTEEEITTLSNSFPGLTCNNGYTNDNVRLMTSSEFYNLTPYYSTQSGQYPVQSFNDNRAGKIAYVDYITRLSSNDWLYSSTIGSWYLTTVYTTYSQMAQLGSEQFANYDGQLAGYGGMGSLAIRPVIVLQK